MNEFSIWEYFNVIAFTNTKKIEALPHSSLMHLNPIMQHVCCDRLRLSLTRGCQFWWKFRPHCSQGESCHCFSATRILPWMLILSYAYMVTKRKLSILSLLVSYNRFWFWILAAAPSSKLSSWLDSFTVNLILVNSARLIVLENEVLYRSKEELHHGLHQYRLPPCNQCDDLQWIQVLHTNTIII